MVSEHAQSDRCLGKCRATAGTLLVAILVLAAGVGVAGCWYRSNTMMRHDAQLTLPRNVEVWVYADGAVTQQMLIDVDAQLADAFAAWHAERAAWERAGESYAPGLLMRTDAGCTINFVDPLIVVNCNGRQNKRRLTDADVALKDAVLHAINLNLPVELVDE